MGTEQTLRIFTDSTTRQAFIDTLKGVLANGWSESPVPIKGADSSRGMYWFTWVSFIRGPVQIGLRKEQDGSLVDGWLSAESFPRGSEDLTDEEQFLIWKNFYTQVKPVADRLGIRMELVGDQDFFACLVSPRGMELLEHFSEFYGTSISHPDSAKRWYAFVVEAHRSDSLLSADDLRGWMLARGWSGQTVDTLACVYQHGRQLLTYLDTCE